MQQIPPPQPFEEFPVIVVFVILGEHQSRQQIPPPPNPVHRYAWEDFDNVGFRTVRKAG